MGRYFAQAWCWVLEIQFWPGGRPRPGGAQRSLNPSCSLTLEPAPHITSAWRSTSPESPSTSMACFSCTSRWMGKILLVPGTANQARYWGGLPFPSLEDSRFNSGWGRSPGDLSWRIPRTKEPGGLQSTMSQKIQTRVSRTTTTHLKQVPGAAAHSVQWTGRERLSVLRGIVIRLTHQLPGKLAECHTPHHPFDKLLWWRCSELKFK